MVLRTNSEKTHRNYKMANDPGDGGGQTWMTIFRIHPNAETSAREVACEVKFREEKLMGRPEPLPITNVADRQPGVKKKDKAGIPGRAERGRTVT